MNKSIIFVFVAVAIQVVQCRIVHKISDHHVAVSETVQRCRATCLEQFLPKESNHINIFEECTDNPNCFMCWDYCKILHKENRIISNIMCSDEICVSILIHKNVFTVISYKVESNVNKTWIHETNSFFVCLSLQFPGCKMACNYHRIQKISSIFYEKDDW